MFVAWVDLISQRSLHDFVNVELDPNSDNHCWGSIVLLFWFAYLSNVHSGRKSVGEEEDEGEEREDEEEWLAQRI